MNHRFEMCEHLSFPLLSYNWQGVYYFGSCIENGIKFDILVSTCPLYLENKSILYLPGELNPDLWACIQTKPLRASSFNYFGIFSTNKYANGSYTLNHTKEKFYFVPEVIVQKDLMQIVAELENG